MARIRTVWVVRTRQVWTLPGAVMVRSSWPPQVGSKGVASACGAVSSSPAAASAGMLAGTAAGTVATGAATVMPSQASLRSR